MAEKYFMLSNMDGDMSIQIFNNKESLLEEINDEESQEYLREVKNIGEWGYKKLIIKGSIVIPTPKKVVETFDIE